MSILENTIRNGNITNSGIVALTSMGSRDMTEDELAEYKKSNPKSKKKTIECWPGKAAITYIDEKNIERRLMDSIDDESNAKPLLWGKLMELRVNELLPHDYILNSQESIMHPTIQYWCGSKDGERANLKTDFEIKCPYTKKSFATLVQPFYDGLRGMDAINAIREKHTDGEKYYWQMVGNACISGAKFAELIIYMPYQSELKEIKEMIDGDPDYYWLNYANDNQIPFLKDGGYYKNLNIISFEIPQEDKDFLTECVLKAGKMLIPFYGEPSVVLAHHDTELNTTIIQPENLTPKNNLKF